MIDWTSLWMKLFGTTEWMQIDMGFWVSMGISALVAIAMVIVFRSTKPYDRKSEEEKNDIRGDQI